MNELTYDKALNQHLRKPGTYLEQFASFVISICRLLGTWIWLTTTLSVCVVLITYMYTDLREFTYEQLQEGLRTIVSTAGVAAAVVCVVANPGKFKNVFSERAIVDVQRYVSVKDSFYSQVETTEGLLIKHGLIDEASRTVRSDTAS